MPVDSVITRCNLLFHVSAAEEVFLKAKYMGYQSWVPFLFTPISDNKENSLKKKKKSYLSIKIYVSPTKIQFKPFQGVN